jgi:adenylylsulfate kinase-like enzyme
VLWVCGPAGVGKSTASWQLYTELAEAGVRVAFADSDQLCMCYPAPPGDPGRQHVKALNVSSMISGFRSAGARCVIVNGVLDAAGLDTGLLPNAEVTICRLRAGASEVERRLRARDGQRDGPAGVGPEIRDEIRRLDDSRFADACVDTTGVPAGDVAGLVRAACPDWPGFTGDWPGFTEDIEDAAGLAALSPGPPAGGQVALITGPTGVGKSTIGFLSYQRCLQAGLTAGYVDLGQIGFVRPADAGDPGHQRLKARNLAAIWRNYRAAGATHLVATGRIGSPADSGRYSRELKGTGVTLIRLRAGSDDLRLRIMSRGAGGSWPEPGDRLRGRPAEFLGDLADRVIADQINQDAEARDRADGDGVAIDTTGRSPDESADAIARALGWFP